MLLFLEEDVYSTVGVSKGSHVKDLLAAPAATVLGRGGGEADRAAGVCTAIVHGIICRPSWTTRSRWENTSMRRSLQNNRLFL